MTAETFVATVFKWMEPRLPEGATPEDWFDEVLAVVGDHPPEIFREAYHALLSTQVFAPRPGEIVTEILRAYEYLKIEPSPDGRRLMAHRAPLRADGRYVRDRKGRLVFKDDVRVYIRDHLNLHGAQINAMMAMAPEAEAGHFDRALIECSPYYPAEMNLSELAERLSRTARLYALTDLHGDQWAKGLTDVEEARLEMCRPVFQHMTTVVGRTSVYRTCLQTIQERRAP